MGQNLPYVELLFQFSHSGQNLVLEAFQICLRMFLRKKKEILAYISLFLTSLAVNKDIK